MNGCVDLVVGTTHARGESGNTSFHALWPFPLLLPQDRYQAGFYSTTGPCGLRRKFSQPIAQVPSSGHRVGSTPYCVRWTKQLRPQHEIRLRPPPRRSDIRSAQAPRTGNAFEPVQDGRIYIEKIKERR